MREIRTSGSMRGERAVLFVARSPTPPNSWQVSEESRATRWCHQPALDHLRPQPCRRHRSLRLFHHSYGLVQTLKHFRRHGSWLAPYPAYQRHSPPDGRLVYPAVPRIPRLRPPVQIPDPRPRFDLLRRGRSGGPRLRRARSEESCSVANGKRILRTPDRNHSPGLSGLFHSAPRKASAKDRRGVRSPLQPGPTPLGVGTGNPRTTRDRGSHRRRTTSATRRLPRNLEASPRRLTP